MFGASAMRHGDGARSAMRETSAGERAIQAKAGMLESRRGWNAWPAREKRSEGESVLISVKVWMNVASSL